MGGGVGKLTLAEGISAFGKDTKAALSNPAITGQPEDQLRTPLLNLFKTFAELTQKAGMVSLVGETSLAGMQTRPDFAVTVGIGKAKALVGFIEVKAPGKGFDPRKFKDEHDKAQWVKLKALPNLIYSDGNGFSLWRNGELVGKPVALDGDIETSGTRLAAPPGVLALIEDFLSWEPMAPRNAPELAATSARLCRFLRDEVVEQMEEGSKPLLDLAKDWRTLLFPNADNEQFADGYAQAVTFGLLMAKSLGLSLEDDLDAVGKRLGQSNTLIGTALRLLTEQPDTLSASLQTMTRVLDVVEWDKVSKGDPEAWLYFYEQFLDTYDRKLRKLTGSYYTPPQVVEAMVRLCDEALKSPGRFNVGRGLADAQVHIADPAMGSGTYLLAIVRRIADAIGKDQGDGAVLAAMGQAVERLYGFELQFGAFAVAQLRLLAEMIEVAKRSTGKGTVDEAALKVPHLFVTDTLGDPYEHEETGTGIGRLLSHSRVEANKVKTSQRITVVIGNPPYKEKAKGRGSWVEQGSANRSAPFKDWQPPNDYGRAATSNAKHLRNLYVYFWRWAAWKVFEQGSGGRDKEPPVDENLSGIVCYITVAGFLNGPGFQKMRADLRRECDEIWVIDCSPEGMMPKVNTRIFEGVKHPVCIVLASRSPSNDPNKPARLRFRSLAAGNRKDKFKELARTSLSAAGWVDGASELRAPFLPEHAGGWGDFVALDDLLIDRGLGVMPGRTWPIAPDARSLRDRWDGLIGEKDPARRSILFHPHESGGPSLDKGAKALAGHHGELVSINAALLLAESKDSKEAAKGKTNLRLQTPARYGFRSFDRQWIIPDNRLLNRENASLWGSSSKRQVYLTALSQTAPKNGPAATLSAFVPDHDHYKGSAGGRVFALWKDPVGEHGDIAVGFWKATAKSYGSPAPDPEDVFAYVAALLAHPAYTKRFKADLIRPGLRVPLTAARKPFDKAAKLGREIVWLHTFGERFADGHPAGEPRLPEAERPKVLAGRPIPDSAAGFPDSIDYDAAKRELKVGSGVIAPVAPEVWAYEVSGKQVLRQWFSYRKKNRERPQIGDRRPPSPLGDIQPDHWLPEYTTELLNVINVLGLLVNLEPKQAELLDEICDGPLIAAGAIQP